MNSAALVTERQALPKPLEHALNLARLPKDGGGETDVEVLAVNFANAFMSVPIAEWRGRTMLLCFLRRS